MRWQSVAVEAVLHLKKTQHTAYSKFFTNPKRKMNIRDFWGHLDPISIVCFIMFASMLILLIVLLTVTQRCAAQEVVNACEEHSRSLESQRYILRQRRQIQNDEIARARQPDPMTKTGRSRVPNPSATQKCSLDPYKVPPRKPTPGLQSQEYFTEFKTFRAPTSPSVSNFEEGGESPLQHSPLFFQRPGYEPVPIFDRDDNLASPLARSGHSTR